MPVRTRAILLGIGFAVVAVIWYLFLWSPQRSRVDELKKQETQARATQQDLQSEIARLKDIQAQEPKLRTDLARLQDALPSDPRLPDFILQLQESASLAGIDFLTISPSLPAPFVAAGTPSAGAAPPPAAAGAAGQLQAITLQVTTTGRYFEVLDFIVRLERLRRAVRINNIAMSPSTVAASAGSSPVLAVSFTMQMFLTSTAPAAPGASAAPATTPAPGTSPTASPSPSPAARTGG